MLCTVKYQDIIITTMYDEIVLKVREKVEIACDYMVPFNLQYHRRDYIYYLFHLVTTWQTLGTFLYQLSDWSSLISHCSFLHVVNALSSCKSGTKVWSLAQMPQSENKMTWILLNTKYISINILIECLSSDGQLQFHQYQQNEQPPPTLTLTFKVGCSKSCTSAMYQSCQNF